MNETFVERPMVPVSVDATGPSGTVIITGGNSGLGLATARRILQLDSGLHMVLACRDASRGRAAVEELRGEERSVECRIVDLASLESVRSFVASIAAAGLPPIQALICNAGIQVVSRPARSADGYELSFAVNHLAHFLLANLLLARMATAGRIVFVTSDTHDPAQRTGLPAPRYSTAAGLARGEEPNGESHGIAGRRAYSTSKLCNVLCAYEFSRRLAIAGWGVSSNAFNPGLMPGTGLARDYPAPLRVIWHTALRVMPLVSGTARTVAHSARDLAHLALDPELCGVTARYFSGAKAVPSSVDSYDPAKARDLWSTSVRLARLRPAESPLVV